MAKYICLTSDHCKHTYTNTASSFTIDIENGISSILESQYRYEMALSYFSYDCSFRDNAVDNIFVCSDLCQKSVLGETKDGVIYYISVSPLNHHRRVVHHITPLQYVPIVDSFPTSTTLTVDLLDEDGEHINLSDNCGPTKCIFVCRKVKQA